MKVDIRRTTVIDAPVESGLGDPARLQRPSALASGRLDERDRETAKPSDQVGASATSG